MSGRPARDGQLSLVVLLIPERDLLNRDESLKQITDY